LFSLFLCLQASEGNGQPALMAESPGRRSPGEKRAVVIIKARDEF